MEVDEITRGLSELILNPIESRALQYHQTHRPDSVQWAYYLYIVLGLRMEAVDELNRKLGLFIRTRTE